MVIPIPISKKTIIQIKERKKKAFIIDHDASSSFVGIFIPFDIFVRNANMISCMISFAIYI